MTARGSPACDCPPSSCSLERLAQEQAVPDAARRHDQPPEAAEDQRLLDEDGAGQDGVGALRVQTPKPAPFALGRDLQPVTQFGDVSLAQAKPLALPAALPVL